ncbi:MAG: beta-lactamase family protein, partial [Bacteroidia bacterium]|nr:beta-lactamase family protein [Bacteroidia bacterium]
MTKKRTYIALSGLIFLALPLFLSHYTPEHATFEKKAVAKPRRTSVQINPYLQEVIDEYEGIIEQLQASSHTPGAAVVIVHDSTIIFMSGFGVRSTDAPDSVDENTVFRLASVSKSFAATLTGTLVQDGLLHWNDKVVQYLPEFSLHSKDQTEALTLAHVLSHTTGLPYHTYTNLVEENLPLDTLLSYLEEVPLIAKPGELYCYQNVAYSIIGKVDEAAALMSYEELMRERVFQPLGMEHASISYEEIMHADNVALPHYFRRGRWHPTKVNTTYYNVAPAGGVNASISDMGKWIIALLGHEPAVLSDSVRRAMFTPQVVATSKNRNYGRWHRLRQAYYGLGWRVLHYPSDTLVYHGGYANGYRSEV